MEDPTAASQPGPALQDSVVGGNLHTGNIIHNHYHVNQTTTTVSTPHLGATQQVSAEPQRRPAIYVNASGNPLASEDRNLVLAYVFCFCLGYLGAHRFYLGHIGIGILYVFTFGFFGLGWFIDLIILPDLVHARNQRSIPT